MFNNTFNHPPSFSEGGNKLGLGDTPILAFPTVWGRNGLLASKPPAWFGKLTTIGDTASLARFAARLPLAFGLLPVLAQTRQLSRPTRDAGCVTKHNSFIPDGGGPVLIGRYSYLGPMRVYRYSLPVLL